MNTHAFGDYPAFTPIAFPRSQVSILPLVLTRKWYDMIKSGVKREEYRDHTNYYAARLNNWYARNEFPVVEFRLGYAKDAPRMLFWVATKYLPCRGFSPFATRTRSAHPEWGEPSTPHFVLFLGGPCQLY